jgi:hypothetical protein
MEEDDDDQRLLHSLGVTSANIEDIEKKILSQASPPSFVLQFTTRFGLVLTILCYLMV